jgi:UDPglucose--hexose-1-phosphate uridylyltransferase
MELEIMSELRWNPLLRTWTMVASHRQNRPQMPRDWCPFDPGSGRVPDDYDVLKYDNDFPALSIDPPEPDPVAGGSDIYRTEKAYGKCEVILYSPEHKKSLCQLPVDHIRKVVDLWIERAEELSKDKKVQYVFPFENKGEEVGVTMPHPHGQIYAYPYVPLKIKTELDSSREYFQESGKCLLCKMNEEEFEFRKRVIFENGDFVAYIPFFTDYPYGVFIVSKLHRSSLAELEGRERDSLAQALKVVTGSFDMLFDRPFPYMMVTHHSPVNSGEYKDSGKYFHLHFEFYPPLRDKDRIKYYASSEMGAWACANVVPVEESARSLRRAKLRFLSAWDNAILRKEIVKEFVNTYGGKEGDVFVYAAPSRVNLIGEHTDYNGGMVLPAALDMPVYMAIRKRKDGEITFKDLNFPETAKMSVNTPIGADTKEGIPWLNYPKGVLKVLVDKGYKIDRGFDVLYFSEIPIGAGLSSSAAFEVVFAMGLSEMFTLGISRENMALLCQKAENEFVGVQCGIMDQYAVTFGKKGSAILLNCGNMEMKYIPLDLGEYRLVITNTNKPRKLKDSAYNERRAQCEAGLAELRKKTELADLGQLDMKRFEQLKETITDPVIQKRVRHVVTENERVKQAADALSKGDLREFGKLMERSHSSLRDDFEVTGLELDTLFEKARNTDGCIGTRMTGAGFGGCTVSLVHKDKIESFKTTVAEGYTDETGLTPAFYVCDTGDGVKRIS